MKHHSSITRQISSNEIFSASIIDSSAGTGPDKTGSESQSGR
ncbi:unnamed protein product, partial [Rotaria magnacalcarata]